MWGMCYLDLYHSLIWVEIAPNLGHEFLEWYFSLNFDEMAPNVGHKNLE